MSDFRSERQSTAQMAYFQLIEGIDVKIGVAINTPYGIMIWGHDFGQVVIDLTDENYLPLLLDTVDSFETAADRIRDHTEAGLRALDARTQTEPDLLEVDHLAD